MASDFELSAMRQAITLSALGHGTTSLTSRVGCVILDRDGTVVGAGFHRRNGSRTLKHARSKRRETWLVAVRLPSRLSFATRSELRRRAVAS